MTPDAISMAMAKLTLTISSSSPIALARQAERRKMRIYDWMRGQAQGPVPTGLEVEFANEFEQWFALSLQVMGGTDH